MTAGEGGKRGSLVAVGTGICVVGQLTMEAMAWMRRADRVLHVVGDPVAEASILQLNPGGAESLKDRYVEGRPREEAYEAMVGRVLTCLQEGMMTCLAFYGHPAVFAYPVHESVRRAREAGFEARILPGISAEDCLFADLGIDPATHGCQAYDATDFLLHGRTIDPTSALILWQIGVVGDLRYRRGGAYDRSLLPLLAERLAGFHSPDHVGYVYEAALLPGAKPVVRPTSLGDLPMAAITSSSTFYLPPSRPPEVDLLVKTLIESLLATKPTTPTAVQ